jgi:hypothetical protein
MTKQIRCFTPILKAIQTTHCQDAAHRFAEYFCRIMETTLVLTFFKHNSLMCNNFLVE